MVARYPDPVVSNRPLLSFASFSGSASPKSPSIEDAGRVIWLTSGRVAIAVGLQGLGIGAGDEVLLPAYNCTTMVAAIQAVGAKPVYFKCDADLAPDMADVEARISASTRALLVVHYFGFPQKIDEIAAFARDRGVSLIEDCAHAYFGQFEGRPLGAFGDFSVASAMKLFPVSDGGCLVFPDRRESPVRLHPGGFGFEFKSFINNLERSVHFGRFTLLKWPLKFLIVLKDFAWSAAKKSAADRADVDDTHDPVGPRSSYGGYGFDADWMNIRMSWFSRMLIRLLPRGRIISRRRANYMRLVTSLSGFANATPLFPQLPEGVIPYVFPIVIDPVDMVFRKLKNAGIPILRWEEIGPTHCENSARYAMQLLQFPCHEDLRDEELSWMIDQIKNALGTCPESDQ